MIIVTQGHENGIGIEVFLKSFLMLSREEKKEIKFFVNKEVFNKNLVDLKLDPLFFKELTIEFVPNNPKAPSSTSTLVKALENIKTDDILVTLPTAKDQLVFKEVYCAGYTEFFRNYFKSPNIAMTFKGLTQNVLLITDHMAIKDVPIFISQDLIINKIQTALKFYAKYFYKIDEVIVSGINPHVGENGILGNEDSIILPAINILKKSFTDINFIGPLSGDTLHMHEQKNLKQLFVYMFHDQGLAPFKAQHGLIGLNISMGLPFLRLSVDHGTAPGLYGKNMANLSGMLFLLKQAFGVTYYVNQRN